MKCTNTCKLIASPIPCVQKYDYKFAACLSKSVGFLQNHHGILSSNPEDSVSKHKESGENNDFLQNYNDSNLIFLNKSVRAGTVCNGTE